jgi:hypothetical protein
VAPIPSPPEPPPSRAAPKVPPTPTLSPPHTALLAAVAASAHLAVSAVGREMHLGCGSWGTVEGHGWRDWAWPGPERLHRSGDEEEVVRRRAVLHRAVEI